MTEAETTRVNITACPLCAAPTPTQWLKSMGFQLVRCKSCDFRYSSQIFGPDYLANSYYDEPASDIAARSLESKRDRFVEYEAMLSAIFAKPGRVLDVGCNAGELLDLFRAAGWSVAGVEPSPGPARFAKQKFGDNVWQGRVEEVLPEHQRFDLITLSHVLEHVHDPIGLMRRLKNSLQPKGAILVEVPNANDFLLRFWKGSYRPLCPGDHLSFFDEHSLRRTFEKAGFEVVALSSPVHARDIVYASLMSAVDAARDALSPRRARASLGVGTQTRYRGRLRRPLRAAIDRVVHFVDPLVVAGTKGIRARHSGAALILLAQVA